MSDKPKFTVIDRRKVSSEGEIRPEANEAEQQEQHVPAAEEPSHAGPRLVTPAGEPVAGEPSEPELPPPPTAEESAQQQSEYEKNARGLEDLLRASNPGMRESEKAGFGHLVQQLYLTAMLQMGAGTPEGERPRIDILGARQTIDLVGVLAEKTKGNLNTEETQLLDRALFELRMAFLELTNMISTQAKTPPPTGGNQ